MENKIRDYVKANLQNHDIYVGYIGGSYGRWALALGYSDYRTWQRIRSQNITCVGVFTKVTKADEKYLLQETRKKYGRCPWFTANTEIFGDFDTYQDALFAARNLLTSYEPKETDIYEIVYLDHLA